MKIYASSRYHYATPEEALVRGLTNNNEMMFILSISQCKRYIRYLNALDFKITRSSYYGFKIAKVIR